MTVTNMTIRTKPPGNVVPGLVSVIVPTKNRASMVCDSLQSVFRQTYRPIEVLVIDDGSTDETESVVGDWALQTAEDKQFAIQFIKQASAGAPAARNRGFAASRGQFIQFLDSDDLLHHDKFCHQVAVFHCDPEVDYVYSGAGMFRSAVDWEVEPQYGKPDDVTLATHIRTSNLTTVCGIYRRRICEAIGPWDEQLAKWQDWEYHVRLLAAGARCASVSEVHALNREHDAGRIADLSRASSGLESMACAVSKAEAAAVDNGCYDKAVSEALAVRWSLVAAEAIRWGYPSLAVSAVNSAWRHRVTPPRRLRLGVLRLLAYLPPRYGCTACEKLLAVAHAHSRMAARRHDYRSTKHRTPGVAS